MDIVKPAERALSSPTSFEEKRSLISTFATFSPRRRSIAIDQCVRTFVRSPKRQMFNARKKKEAHGKKAADRPNFPRHYSSVPTERMEPILPPRITLANLSNSGNLARASLGDYCCQISRSSSSSLNQSSSNVPCSLIICRSAVGH